MGKGKKLLNEWTHKVPTDVRLQDVKTFLNTYFPEMWDHKGSSHMVVRCEALKAFQDYKPFGEISIPIKGGQKVKGFYIKELLKAVQLLNERGDAP